MKDVICEMKETSEVSPKIAPVYSLESFHSTGRKNRQSQADSLG